MLKKTVRSNLDDVALCCGVVGSVFLLIHIITGAVLSFCSAQTSLLLSGIILPIAAGIMILIVTVSHVIFSFPQALRCSQTRRRTMVLTLGVTGFVALCAMGSASVLVLVERSFAPIAWQRLAGADGLTFGKGNTVISEYTGQGWALFVEDFSLDWQWFFFIALGAMAMGFIVGAVIQRFGGKGGWFLWAIWMVGCFAPQLLPWERYTITNWLFPCLCVILIVGLIWSVWSLLHAVIKA